MPRFPSNSIRQRSSDVPITDPEREFEKTALDTCRGTIIQQEAELKRLNEGLDIRNKRIMQLDSQMGIASTFISSRDAQESHPAMNSESLAKITDSIHLILAKLAVLTDQQSSKTQSVYVYNNMQNANKPEALTKGTQTITVPPGTSAKPEESLFGEDEETTAEEILESVEDVLYNQELTLKTT